MIVSDVLVSLMLRNMATMLSEIAEDGRLYDVNQSNLRLAAKSLRDIAHMVEKLPPFVPD